MSLLVQGSYNRRWTGHRSVAASVATMRDRLLMGGSSLGTATHSQDVYVMLADHFRDIEALSNRLDELGRHL